jgi:hypothetical protein
MSTTPGDTDFLNQHVRMARAWLAFTTKNTRELQIIPPISLGVSIITIGTTSLVDSKRQDCFNLVHKAYDLRFCDIAYTCRRVNLRAPERFVGVDISHPSDHLLIKQRGFDQRIFAPLKAFVEHPSGRRIFERLWTDAFHKIDQLDLGRRV